MELLGKQYGYRDNRFNIDCLESFSRALEGPVRGQNLGAIFREIYNSSFADLVYSTNPFLKIMSKETKNGKRPKTKI